MNNRYIFFKRLYKDYVVIIQNKSYGIDNKLKDIIKYNNINYVLVDNENNVLVHKVNNNKYLSNVNKDEFVKNFFIFFKLK